jgi:hypothetical protein
VAYRPVATQIPQNKRDKSRFRQRRGKHVFITIKLLLETVLCNSLLGSCNSWITTMETGVFPMRFVLMSYLEDNLGDPVS